MNEVRGTDKKYIKYNSLPKDEIGNKIRILTKEIKKEIFKDKRIKEAKKETYKSYLKEISSFIPGGASHLCRCAAWRGAPMPASTVLCRRLWCENVSFVRSFGFA